MNGKKRKTINPQVYILKNYPLGMKRFPNERKTREFPRDLNKELIRKFFRLKQNSTRRKLKPSGMKEQQQK